MVDTQTSGGPADAELLAAGRVPVSVVVPVRNARDLIGECLASIVAARPAEVIVVDGASTDGTREVVGEIAAVSPVPVRLLDDDGRGVSAARTLGVRAAASDVVALIDADVVLAGADDLAHWYDEYVRDGWVGLQAGLAPEPLDDGDYWARCLAHHQQTGRSRHWFTLCATLMDRTTLLEQGFDDSFASGEDIELRHRYLRAGLPVGVSAKVHVRHRFEGGWKAALHQWTDDGAGLARTIRKNGWRDLPLLGIPLAATVRGVVVTARRPSMLGYWLCYLFHNYASLLRTLATGPLADSLFLTAGRVAPMGMGFLTWLLVARWFDAADVGYAALGLTVATLTTHVAAGGTGSATLVGARTGRAGAAGRLLLTVALAVVWSGGLAAGLDLAGVVPGRLVPWFVGLSVVLSLAYYLDHVAVGNGRSRQVLARSVLQSAAMLGCLVLAHVLGGRDGAVVTLGASMAGGLLSVAAGWPMRVPAGARPDADAAGTFVQILVTLAHRGPMLALPLVVGFVADAAAVGVWYVVWMLWQAVWFVPNSIAVVLQGRLRTQPKPWDGEIRSGRRRALLLGVAAGAVVLTAAPLVLHLMGPAYFSAYDVLAILVVGVVPACFAELALARLRADRRALEAVPIWGLCTGLVVVAVLVASPPLSVVAVLWVAGQCVLAVVSTGWRR